MNNLIKTVKELVKHSHTSKNALFSLILVNFISIFFAVYKHWQLSEVLLLFWAQNIIIGIFALYKLVNSKNIVFTKEEQSISINQKKVKAKSLKTFSIFIFGLKFFIFNLFYLLFFKDFIDLGKGFIMILIPLGVFILNHLISLFLNYKRDFYEPTKFKVFTTLVFIRVLPIHIFLIFGIPLVIGSFIMVNFINLIGKFSIDPEGLPLTIGVIFFMFLKMSLEIIAHMISHTDSDYLDKNINI